jgi:hypothetical protein
MVFYRIFLICLLDVSAWPLVWGWYGVAMLWWTPCSARYFRKTLSMKWDTPSLMTIQGTPKRGNMTSWNILLACFESTVPFGHIVHSHQNVFTIPVLRERPHEINPPYIKEFYLEIVHERHRILRVDVPLFLASVASPDKLLCIFIHRWPEKPLS